MKHDLLKMNPQREHVLGLTLRLRNTYPEEFPAAWAEAGQCLKDNGDFTKLSPFGQVCFSFRLWPQFCFAPPVELMGEMKNGMIWVDMQRLRQGHSRYLTLELDDEDFD